MNSISPISFYGHGSESTGSVAYANKKASAHKQCGVNFQGEGDKFEKNKGAVAVGVATGIVALTAATIFGLGYAHKTNLLSKMKDGTFMKKIMSKASPAMEKCYGWCKAIKAKCGSVWNSVQNIFKSKKS